MKREMCSAAVLLLLIGSAASAQEHAPRPTASELTLSLSPGAEMTDPRLEELRLRHKRILQRGSLAFAFVDTPLPPGAIGIVRINQSGPRRRYVVVNDWSFTDEVILRTRLATVNFEVRHEDDTSPVELAIYADHIDIISERDGMSTVASRMEGRVEDQGRRSTSLREAAAGRAAVRIPGFGHARFVDMDVVGR